MENDLLSTHTVLSVAGWGLLAVACVMAAQGVHMLVTGRFPSRSAKAERASRVRPQAWSLLFLALAGVALALPLLLDWPDEWQIASNVLVLPFVVGAVVMRAKERKAASSTESRDIHRTP